MGDAQGVTGILARRLGIIVFAGMVAALGAHELQRRHHAKNKGVSPSKIATVLRGEVDFTQPKLAETVNERAALKRELDDAPERSTKETLRVWADKLLK